MMNFATSIELLPGGWPVDQANPASTASTKDEQLLAAQGLAGKVDLFNQMVEGVQATAYQMAYHLLEDGEAAADAVQETLLKAFRALPTYRGGSFKSWFIRILINNCYDMLRARKRRAAASLWAPTPEGEDRPQLVAGDQPEAHVERMELRHWLERGIGTLPVDQRVVLVLYDVEGFSYNEIVEFTGIPIGTVKSRLSRGRIRLRDFLVRHKVLAL